MNNPYNNVEYVDYDSGDQRVIRHKVVTLRKDRKCMFCGVLMEKGTKAYRSISVDDDGFFSDYSCENVNDCNARIANYE